MDFDRDLTRLHDGTAAKITWETLKDHLEGEQRRLDNKMFEKLTQGVVINGDEALQFIHEKFAHFALVRRLHQKLAAGASASQRLTPLMEGAANG